MEMATASVSIRLHTALYWGIEWHMLVSLVNGVGNDINLRGLGAAGFRQRSDYSEAIAAAEVGS
jgi:hypothetical protein